MNLLNEINNKTKKNVFKAPEKTSVGKNDVSIFLGGSIEMGKAKPWQDELTKDLLKKYENIIIFNPRRSDWDNTWTQEITDKNFYGQVDWEHEHITKSDVCLIYFQGDTKSPIRLLELGLCAGLNHNTIVCVEKDFWRKGNVDYICKKYKIKQIDKLDHIFETFNSNKKLVKK
jgi:hypothetical protein